MSNKLFIDDRDRLTAGAELTNSLIWGLFDDDPANQTLQFNAVVRITSLTASRLVSTDADKDLTSVTNLATWIGGTANEIDVTDDGDGTITIGIVDPLIVGKGGSGAATFTDHSILLGSGTDPFTALGAATNGQLPIGSTGADPVLATLTGTADEIDVTNAAGSITIGLVNPLIVGKGGSGAATFTDHSILLGSGTDAFTALGAATNGQLPIGSTGADPVLAALTGTANQVTVTNAAGSITLATPQSIATSSSPQFARLYLDSTNTYLDTDGSNNLTFTDAVTGTRTLKNIGCPVYHYIKATGQAEGDLHLSDGTNWAVSKALIKYIRVITSSTDWDMYILQNDNGYVADDATIPAMKIADGIIGNANLWLDLPYQDEDASSEVHLYYLDNSGANTATIIIKATELV